MIDSAVRTAKIRPQIICYVDDDDRSYDRGFDDVEIMVGPRITMTDYWNKLLPLAKGDIFCQANDDIVFVTPNWDVIVETEFAHWPDRIVMVHGDGLGGGNRQTFGTHPFVHRRWVETLGYFTPPYFRSDFGDTWINELANGVGRRVFVPIVMEHLHFIWGKAPMDETTIERLAWHQRDNPEQMYNALASVRERDIQKLETAIGRRKPMATRKRATSKVETNQGDPETESLIPETDTAQPETETSEAMPSEGVLEAQGAIQTGPKLSIMILTQPSRAAFLDRLLAALKPQVETHPDIDIDIRTFDKSMSLGANREVMRQAAKGEYICFIDDDDMVPGDYISKIYPLLDGVDQIGFRVQLYVDGVAFSKTYHSLKYGTWNSDDQGHYRDISHINPMRRELAVQAPIEGGHGEDARWSDRMRALGIVKTEHYIDQVMYFYYYRSNKAPDDLETRTLQPIPVPITRAANLRCPACNSEACGFAGGQRRCNQCGHMW